MRYLRPVRIDENKDEVPNDNDEENLRQRGFLDPTSRAAIRRAIKTHEKLGNHKRVAELEGQLEKAEEALKTPLAPAATAPQRYPRLAGFGPAGLRTARLQPRKESFIPLTLPNLMEINIVKGSDGKPVVASGKGTRLKKIAQPTEAALKRRRAGTQHARSERVLKRLQASDRRTALIKRGRGEEATQVPSPPVSTDAIGGNRPGGDAGTGEATRRGIASRGHTR